MSKLIPALVVLLSAALLLPACGGDDGTSSTPGGGSSGPTGEGTPIVSPVDMQIAPPLEGPPRLPAATERTNFRDMPVFRLPSPDELPEPPDDADGPEFQPPAEPGCPEGWEKLQRPADGFELCYPKEWIIKGHGYVGAGAEDRYYSVGLFLFRNNVEVAHVSLYVVGAFTKPFTYTRDCEQAYKVTFAGQPAVLCPDAQGAPPEVRIIAYHLRRDDLDYFVNAVPKFEYDPDEEKYLEKWDKEAEATAIQIAQTVKLIPIASVAP